MFNEAEQEAVPDAQEPAVSKVDGYYRKNSKTNREELLTDLPVQEVLCDLPEEERISIDGLIIDVQLDVQFCF